MSEDPEAERAFSGGFTNTTLGVTPEELASKSDGALALWQAHEAAGSARYILAEREWQRRMLDRQSKLQLRNGAWIALVGAIAGALITVATGLEVIRK